METRRRRKEWTTGKKILAILGGMVAVFVFLGWSYWNAVNSDPKIVIPTPTMPSPNGFDYFLKATQALKNDPSIGTAVSSLALYGRSAPPAFSQAQLKAMENASAVKLLHQGFQYPYMCPPARSFTTLFPYFADFRQMARFLSLKSDTEAAHGEWSTAINTNLDTIQMGETVPRGGVMIAALVGIACQAIGRKPAWKAVDHLNASQARAAARRLERIMTLHTPYADTLQEEMWCQQAGLLEIFHKANWRHEFVTAINGMSENGGLNFSTLGMELKLAFYGKGRILHDITKSMEQAVANARQPYAAKLPDPSIPDDQISQMLIPVFSQARFKDVTNETQNALLLTTLALHAYRLEHGTYPKILDVLSPTYLKHVPDDQFTLKGTLRYKRAKTGYVLYSVGPDGKDDGGTPIDDPNAPNQATNKNARYMTRNDSLGDIVAGKNLY